MTRTHGNRLSEKPWKHVEIPPGRPVAADGSWRGYLSLDLATELTRAREAAGLSIRELGRRTGVSHGFLSQLENGRRLPSTDTLAALSTVLTYPPDVAERLHHAAVVRVAACDYVPCVL